MYNLHGRGADLPSFCVSAAWSCATLRHHMHSRYLPNSNSFICEASHRKAVSTTFKDFGMTRRRVD